MIRIDQDIIILTPPERLNTATSTETELDVVSEIEKGILRVVIDFSKTTYVSSAGLRVVLKVAKLLHKQKGALVICGLNEQITEVFEVSGFMKLVNVRTTFSEAVDVVRN